MRASAQAHTPDDAPPPTSGRGAHVRELVARWQATRDPGARDELLELHLPWLAGIARRYPQRLGTDDLLQEAQIGFLRALETFDPERGVELTTYARHWVRAHVHRYLLRSWGVVRRFTSHDQRRVFFGAGKARQRLRGAGGPDELRRIARRLKVPENTVVEVEYLRGVRDEALETQSGDDARDRFAADVDGPEELACRAERARLLRERLPVALAQLGPRERHIFLCRADPDEAVPLEELGRELGITRERARQLETRARKQLALALGDLVDAELAAAAVRHPPRRGMRARTVQP